MTNTAFLGNMSDYSDIKLIEMFNSGSELAFTALTDRYLKLIRSITSKYSISGLEPEDLTQEGLLGLLCAAKSYRADGGASFKSYAGLCINRRIISLLNRSGTNKSKPLNDYISLYDDDVAQSMYDENVNPEQLVISNESLASISSDIKQCLSQTEQKVLSLYLAGKSYGQISGLLGTSTKSVDNALQRARQKLKKHISKNMPE